MDKLISLLSEELEQKPEEGSNCFVFDINGEYLCLNKTKSGDAYVAAMAVAPLPTWLEEERQPVIELALYKQLLKLQFCGLDGSNKYFFGIDPDDHVIAFHTFFQAEPQDETAFWNEFTEYIDLVEKWCGIIGEIYQKENHGELIPQTKEGNADGKVPNGNPFYHLINKDLYL